MGKIVNLGLRVLWIVIKCSWTYEQKKQNKQKKERNYTKIIDFKSKCKIIFLTLRNDEGWSHYNWFDITKTKSGVKHWHWITCQGQLVQRRRAFGDFVKTRSNVWKIFTFIFIFIHMHLMGFTSIHFNLQLGLYATDHLFRTGTLIDMLDAHQQSNHWEFNIIFSHRVKTIFFHNSQAFCITAVPNFGWTD